MAKPNNFSDVPGCVFIFFIAWWYVPIVGTFLLIKALVKLIIKTIRESREADERANAVVVGSAPAPVSIPKKYSPPFTFIGSPGTIGDTIEAYRYGFVLSDIQPEILKAGFEAGEYAFTIHEEEGVYYAQLLGANAGIIPERGDMIADWLKRGDPIRLFLNTYTENEDCRVIIVFYKNKSAAHAWREQSVVSLTAYKGRARQEISCYLFAKAELEIGEEDFGKDDDDAVVTYHGEAIGKVPSKIRSRLADDGYAYAEIEEIIEEDNDNGDYICRPVIRIYW